MSLPLEGTDEEQEESSFVKIIFNSENEARLNLRKRILKRSARKEFEKMPILKRVS